MNNLIGRNKSYLIENTKLGPPDIVYEHEGGDGNTYKILKWKYTWGGGSRNCVIQFYTLDDIITRAKWSDCYDWSAISLF